MNLKKIIKEEATGFEWTDEIDAGINLEPNTMYFFQPKAIDYYVTLLNT